MTDEVNIETFFDRFNSIIYWIRKCVVSDWRPFFCGGGDDDVDYLDSSTENRRQVNRNVFIIIRFSLFASLVPSSSRRWILLPITIMIIEFAVEQSEAEQKTVSVGRIPCDKKQLSNDNNSQHLKPSTPTFTGSGI